APALDGAKSGLCTVEDGEAGAIVGARCTRERRHIAEELGLAPGEETRLARGQERGAHVPVAVDAVALETRDRPEVDRVHLGRAEHVALGAGAARGARVAFAARRVRLGDERIRSTLGAGASARVVELLEAAPGGSVDG